MQIISIAKNNDFFHGQAKSTRGRRWKFGFTPRIEAVWVDRELIYRDRVFWVHLRTPPAALIKVVRAAVRNLKAA